METGFVDTPRPRTARERITAAANIAMFLSIFFPLLTGIFCRRCRPPQKGCFFFVSRLQRSLTSLQQRLVKTGGRLVKHARYYWLLLAEGYLTRRRFGAMLGRIAQLPIPTG